MRTYGAHWLKASVVEKLHEAARLGSYDGRMDSAYLSRCTALHAASGTKLILTRDVGHHSSGWLKNPDYERCLHLSISFWEPLRPSVPAEFDEILAREWAELVFPDSYRRCWCEAGSVTAAAKRPGVRHYRVFCDEHWQPLVPRGEVYSTELTERGWKPWSEQNPDASNPSTLVPG